MKAELKDLINKVNSLLQAWSRLPSFNYIERAELQSSAEMLSDMQEDDWDVIREFFAYTPRDREQFFRVKKRVSFLQDPAATLAAAYEWAKTHRRKPVGQKSPPKPMADHEEEITPAQAIAILRGQDTIADSQGIDPLPAPKPSRPQDPMLSLFD